MEWKECVSIVAGTVAAISGGFLFVWFKLSKRRMDLAALTSDDQAARLLTENAVKALLPPATLEEVMTAFARMDSSSKRCLACAFDGLINAIEGHRRASLPEQLRGLVRVFSDGSRPIT